MAAPIEITKKQKIMSFLFWFSLFYLIFFFFFNKPVENIDPATAEVAIMTDKSKYVVGNLPHFTIQNPTDKTYTLTNPCLAGSEKLQLVTLGETQPIACEEGAVSTLTFAPKTEQEVPFSSITQQVFDEDGNYKLRVLLDSEEGEILELTSDQITYKKPGIFRTLYRNLITKPLFNILVFFVDKLPNHSFGIAIILLTIVVRIILLVPNQKAMKSQRALQTIQPKLNELKEKHKGNQQMIAMKTMELYKTHKINPMGSCLPILLQMPFLIGLYHIVQIGLAPHMAYFLYQFQEKVDLTVIQNWFLGIDLTLPGNYILPLIVGGAQWVAFRMTMLRQKKKQEADKKPAKKKDKKAAPSMQDSMAQMNVIMQWALPVMIAFFTFIMPSGVGIYWVTSTLFGIAQQWFVNRDVDKPVVTRKS